jgi:hypothetical protein
MRKPVPLSQQREVTRRRLLQFGGGALGLHFGGLRRASAGEQQGPVLPARIKSCILVFYYGGPSHLDTFDLKPAVPAEVRGEFKPIATSVPGLHIGEHLPRMARCMHKVTLVRSVTHRNRLHDSASIEMLTGRPSPQGDREEFAPIKQFFPCYGSALHYLRRDRAGRIPHAALPFVFHNVVDVPCQGGGFLGTGYDPLVVSADPASGTYGIGAVSLPENMTGSRFEQRRRLLNDLQRTDAAEDAAPGEQRRYYGRAFDLLGSDHVRRALDLDTESIAVRERYGVYPGGRHIDDHTTPGGPKDGIACHMRGQNLLLARRLVEAGVPFVNVYDYKQQGLNWDAHSKNFELHKRDLLPPMDLALSALIEDLDQRGLLETTLVVAMGEFGRTPRINKDAGRDHWPDCYTVLLAGGGVKGGYVHGASDRLGAFPARDPVTPADIAATIFWRFGIDPATEIHDLTGRPWKVSDGTPIRGLFA